MTEQQFQNFKNALKDVSDIKYQDMIDLQRKGGNIEEGFLESLEKSTFFKDIFFNGFMEGTDFAKQTATLQRLMREAKDAQ